MAGESCRAQQLEELECMLSMFPSSEELELSDALREELAVGSAISCGAASDAPSRPPPPVRYSLYFQDVRVNDDEVPSLELVYPPVYPLSAVTFSVHCSALTRAEKETLNDELNALAASAASTGEVVTLELYQHMSAFLSAARDRHRSDATNCDRSDDLQRQLHLTKVLQPRNTISSADAEPVLGRRAIYFHHIIAPTKRRVVMEWALELQLSGFSKIGWPGVVIVEGQEADVQEYVRRLQRLRWKQMVVRGEQTERGGGRSVDEMRKLPRGFREFPEKSGMAALAAACRDAGEEQLFLTTMKIYGRGGERVDSDEEEDADDSGGGSSGSKDGRQRSRGRAKR